MPQDEQTSTQDSRNATQNDQSKKKGVFSVAGLKVNLKNLFTGADDPTIDNVTVLSNPAEKHAVVAGVVGGIIDGARHHPLGTGTALSGTYVTGRVTTLLGVGEHTKDARDQVAYTATGYLLGYAVGMVGGPQAVAMLFKILGM